MAGSQITNSVAFVMDGVLFGCQGFKYASILMPLCAMPAAWVMLKGVEGWTSAWTSVWAWVSGVGRGSLSIPLPPAPGNGASSLTPLTLVWMGLAVFSLVRAVLAVGLSWSHVRRRVSGKLDVDDVEE